MKKLLKVAGLVALFAAVLGFGFIGCKDDGGDSTVGPVVKNPFQSKTKTIAVDEMTSAGIPESILDSITAEDFTATPDDVVKMEKTDDGLKLTSKKQGKTVLYITYTMNSGNENEETTKFFVTVAKNGEISFNSFNSKNSLVSFWGFNETEIDLDALVAKCTFQTDPTPTTGKVGKQKDSTKTVNNASVDTYQILKILTLSEDLELTAETLKKPETAENSALKLVLTDGANLTPAVEPYDTGTADNPKFRISRIANEKSSEELRTLAGQEKLKWTTSGGERIVDIGALGGCVEVIDPRQLSISSVQGPFKVTMYYGSNANSAKTDRYQIMKIGADYDSAITHAKASEKAITTVPLDPTSHTYYYTGTDTVNLYFGTNTAVARFYGIKIDQNEGYAYFENEGDATSGPGATAPTDPITPPDPTPATGKYAELSSAANNLIKEDFSTTTAESIQEFGGVYGVKGLYFDYSGKTTITGATKKIENGALTYGNPNSNGTGANVNAVIDFGPVKEVVEGYFEVKFNGDTSAGEFNNIKFYNQNNCVLQIMGTIAGTKNDITYDGNFTYKLNSVAVTPENAVASAKNTLYKVYYKFDLTNKKMTLTINDKAIFTNTDSNIASITGISINTSDSGKRTNTIDNIAVCGTVNDDLDAYKNSLKAALESVVTNSYTENYTQNATAVSTAKSTGESAISNASDIPAAQAAYKDAITALKAVKNDLAVKKDTAISELNDYAASQNRTFSGGKKTAYDEAIAAGTTAINNAADAAAVDTELANAKAAIDALPDNSNVDTTVTIKDGETSLGTISSFVGAKLTEAQVRAAVTSLAETKKITGFYEEAALSTEFNFSTKIVTENMDIFAKVEDAVQKTEIITATTESLITQEKTDSKGNKSIVTPSGSDFYTGTSFNVQVDSASEIADKTVVGFTKAILPGGNGKTYTIKANKSLSIKLTYTLTDGSWSKKTGAVTYKINNGESVTLVASKEHKKLESTDSPYVTDAVSVSAGQSITITAASVRLAIFQIESTYYD